MSVLARIALTVAALWVAAVVAITILFVLNPSEQYVGDDERGRLILDHGIGNVTRDMVYPESFNWTGFLIAVAVATVVAGLIILLATIWTRGAGKAD